MSLLMVMEYDLIFTNVTIYAENQKMYNILESSSRYLRMYLWVRHKSVLCSLLNAGWDMQVYMISATFTVTYE